MLTVYLLLEDRDGTTTSTLKPVGVALTDEKAAQEWVKLAPELCRRDYEPILVQGSK